MQKLNWSARYVADVGKWLLGAHPLIAIAVAAIVVSLIGLLVPSCPEPRIRWAGMILQLGGVILVGMGLRDTRRAFADEATTWQAIVRWLSRRPAFGPRSVNLSVPGISLGLQMGTPRISIEAGANTPLEERVRLLENHCRRLTSELDELASEKGRQIGELSNALKSEKAERRQSDDEIRSQMRRALAAGLPLARVGVLFFILGITCGTASPEIANWWGGGFCK